MELGRGPIVRVQFSESELVQAWVGQIVTFSRSAPGSRFQKPPSY